MAPMSSWLASLRSRVASPKVVHSSGIGDIDVTYFLGGSFTAVLFSFFFVLSLFTFYVLPLHSLARKLFSALIKIELQVHF